MSLTRDELSRDSLGWKRFGIEVLAVFLVFLLQGASLTPEVNEAHYLVKAKHYWNPEFCRSDLFCESADAHTVFYLTFGLFTNWFSLPIAAWLGRVLGWLILAVTWTRMSHQIFPGSWRGIWSAAIAVVLWQHTHLGGEWIIGGVEAKVLAYGFVFLAIGDWCFQQYSRAIVFAGIAAAFHVLVGGWTLVAFFVAWLLLGKERPVWASLLPAIVIAVVISAAGWWPALALSRGVDAATLSEAHRIYVFERLGHHLVFHRFDHALLLRHGALLVVAILLWRTSQPSDSLRRLYQVVAGAVAIGLAGAVLDQSLLYFPDLAAKLLRFYFFRLSDALLPIGVTFGMLALLQHLAKTRPQGHAFRMSVVLIVLTAHFAWNWYEQWSDPLPAAVLQSLPRAKPGALRLWGPDSIWNPPLVDPSEPIYVPPVNPLDTASNRVQWWRDWQTMCSWVKQSTEPSARFLTPRHQQTFKWYAERPEIVNWKDTPQDAKTLVEWFTISNVVHPYENGMTDLAGHSDERLLELGREYHARYVIFDRTRFQRDCDLPRIYPAEVNERTRFVIYRLE